MKSIRGVYKVGRGPSSSHTIGPSRAASYLKQKYSEAEGFTVTLQGSLALTGKGHGTENAIVEEFKPYPCTVSYDLETEGLHHPNTMIVKAYDENGIVTDTAVVESIGGGDVVIDGESIDTWDDVYPHSTWSDISSYCEKEHIGLYDYVLRFEDENIEDFLRFIWDTMKDEITDGVHTDGILPGGLNVIRKAKRLWNSGNLDIGNPADFNRTVCAFAYAASEQNASNGIVVTAPTCGSCGVVPAVLFASQIAENYQDSDIVRALAVAGVIGNLIKTNASVSGAECGCQAEIGSACSMAAAAVAELEHLSLAQIESAAEIAMEHHLGLTCDPVAGLVQIPCIERNAVAATEALTAESLAKYLTSTQKISFDAVVKTMYETGLDLSHMYKETSMGGLAKLYIN